MHGSMASEFTDVAFKGIEFKLLSSILRSPSFHPRTYCLVQNWPICSHFERYSSFVKAFQSLILDLVSYSNNYQPWINLLINCFMKFSSYSVIKQLVISNSFLHRLFSVLYIVTILLFENAKWSLFHFFK